MPASGSRGRTTPSPTSRASVTSPAFGPTSIGCWGRMVFMAEGGLSLDHRPHAAAWRDRLMAMPGFALPYDLIPKKDAEFDPQPR
jgi:hypothetical protein